MLHLLVAEHAVGGGEPGSSKAVATHAARYIFFVLFVLDVLVRIVVLRHEWYYDSREGIMYLNVFDACVVCVNAFELLVLPLLLASI